MFNCNIIQNNYLEARQPVFAGQNYHHKPKGQQQNKPQWDKHRQHLQRQPIIIFFQCKLHWEQLHGQQQQQQFRLQVLHRPPSSSALISSSTTTTTPPHYHRFDPSYETSLFSHIMLSGSDHVALKRFEFYYLYRGPAFITFRQS